MTPDQTALARELVEHPRWPLKRTPSTRGFRCDDGIMWVFPSYDEMLPDLCDPATAGVLLSMIPEGWMYAVRSPTETCAKVWVGVWRVANGRLEHHRGYGTCLGEACARALLALWAEATP